MTVFFVRNTVIVMPATRRSAGAPRGRTGPARGQSTISFANRVTKSVPKDAKSLATKVDVADRRKPAEAVKVEVKPNLDEQPEHEAGTQEEVEAEEEEEAEQVVLSKSEAELQAEKLSDAHIKRYWEAIEQERKAPRVHQQGLSVNDKVLRYFDVSSQYGVSPSSCPSPLFSLHTHNYTTHILVAVLPNSVICKSNGC